MTLREQIAHRLCRVAEGITANDTVEANEYFYMADEVIRQMEWARAIALIDAGYRADAGVPIKDESTRTAMSLAPEDWR